MCDPQNAIFYLRSKSFEGKVDKVSAWYKTAYQSEKVSEEFLARLKNPTEPITNK